MKTSGCDGCSLVKDTTMGILFDHSQNSEYVPSTRSTQSDYVSVMSPSSTAASWPTSDGLGSIPYSERVLYGKKFRLDRSSDSDYAPPPSKKAVRTLGSKVDVPMTLEDGKKHGRIRCGKQQVGCDPWNTGNSAGDCRVHSIPI